MLKNLIYKIKMVNSLNKIIVLFLLVITPTEGFLNGVYNKVANTRAFIKIKDITLKIFSDTSDTYTEKTCEKASEDLQEFYKNTDVDYQYNFPKRNNGIMNDIIEELFEDHVLPDLGVVSFNYISRSIYLLLFLFLLIEFLLCFIPFYFHSYRKTYFSKRCYGLELGNFTKWCYNFGYIINIVLSSIIVILSIVTFVLTSPISQSITDTGCSIIKLKNHAIYGDEFNSSKGNWPNFKQTKEATEELLDNFFQYSDGLLLIAEKINLIFGNITLFQNQVNNFFIDMKSFKLPNIFNNSENYIPNFIQEIFGIEGDESYKGIISDFLEEQDGAKNKIVNKLKEINEKLNISTYKLNLSSLDENLEKAKTLVYKISDLVDEKEREYGQLYYFYIGKAKTLTTVLIILFGIFIVALAFISGGFTFFFTIKNKYLKHINKIWITLHFFSFFVVLIGIIIADVGHLLRDLSYGLQKYMINIKSSTLIKDNEYLNLLVQQIADHCVSGKGKILGAIFDTVNVAFNEASKFIDKVEEELNENQANLITDAKFKIDSEYLEKLINFIKDIDDDIFLFDTKFLDKNFLEIFKLIDFAQENKYIVEDSIKKVYDFWAITEKDCIKKSLILNENCFLITDLTPEFIKERYSQVQIEINSVRWDLSDYLINNNIISNLQKVVGTINVLKSKLNLAEKNTTALFNNFKDIGNDLFQTTKEFLFEPFKYLIKLILGENSILKVINCGFIKRDLNKILEILYEKMGRNLVIISTLILIEGFLFVIIELVIISFLPIIRKKLENENDEQEKIAELGVELTSEN